MTNFIEQLYRGDIHPQERSARENPGLREAMAALIRSEESLMARLSGEEKRLLEAYIDAWRDVNSASDQGDFVAGFRLGARFAYDTFVNGEEEE